MTVLKEKVRFFFADSSPKGRMLCVLAMIGLGCLLVTATVVLFFGVCTPAITTRPICSSIAQTPPWSLLTSLAAAPSLVMVWWWRTVHKDAEITQARREEHAKRFMDAVQLLSSDKTDAQFGAIYSLEALARESPEDVRRVADTLCAFIRSHGKPVAVPSYEAELKKTHRTVPPPEVQVAVSVVANLDVSGHVLDLRNAQLGGIELKSGFKSPVDLSFAQLFGAQFLGVQLFGTCLEGANLEGAHLYRTHLEGANLEGANLAKASLEGACLDGARLDHANLAGANLDGAFLLWANLEGARLAGASLAGARLSGASLVGARLAVANLEGANLEGANLEGANLSGASYNSDSLFPKGFEPDSVGMVPAATTVHRSAPPLRLPSVPDSDA